MARLNWPWKRSPKPQDEGDLVSAYGVLMPHKKKRDLKFITFSAAIGIAFTVITGFPAANPILTAFYKDELKMSDSLLSVVLAIPQLAVLAQIPFSFVFRRSKGLRWFYLMPALIVRLSFAAISFLAFLAGAGVISLGASAYVVMGIISISSISQWVGDLSFNTWLGLSIPYACRGRYLTNRQMYTTLFTLFYTLVLILVSAPLSALKFQYVIYFLCAAVFGLVEVFLFFPVSVPSKEVATVQLAPNTKVARPSFKDLRDPIRDRNYRNYLAFVVLWYFAIGIPQPYFNVHMNEHMGLSLGLQNLLATGVTALGTVLFAQRLGRLSDRHGNRNVLLFSSLVAVALPFAWLFVNNERIYLIALINFVSGIFFVGTDMNVYSMSIFLAPEDKRPNYLVAKTIAQAILATVPGVLLGGQLMQHLREPLARLAWVGLNGEAFLPFHVTLWLSFVLRGLAVLIFARRIQALDGELGFRAFIRELGHSLLFRVKRLCHRLHVFWYFLRRRLRRGSRR